MWPSGPSDAAWFACNALFWLGFGHNGLLLKAMNDVDPERRLTLRQAEHARADFAIIEDDLEARPCG